MGSSKEKARLRMGPRLNEAKTAAMSLNVLNDQERWRYMSGRIKRLPKQLAVAREYLALLEQEARDLGMDDLL